METIESRLQERIDYLETDNRILREMLEVKERNEQRLKNGMGAKQDFLNVVENFHFIKTENEQLRKENTTLKRQLKEVKGDNNESR